MTSRAPLTRVLGDMEAVAFAAKARQIATTDVVTRKLATSRDPYAGATAALRYRNLVKPH